MQSQRRFRYSRTNEQLKEYDFSAQDERPGSVWQLLMAMRECGLKNDALNETFYELSRGKITGGGGYAGIFVPTGLTTCR